MPRGKSPANIVFSQQGMFSAKEAAALCPWAISISPILLAKVLKDGISLDKRGQQWFLPQVAQRGGQPGLQAPLCPTTAPETAPAAPNVCKAQFGFTHRVSC